MLPKSNAGRASPLGGRAGSSSQGVHCTALYCTAVKVYTPLLSIVVHSSQDVHSIA